MDAASKVVAALPGLNEHPQSQNFKKHPFQKLLVYISAIQHYMMQFLTKHLHTSVCNISCLNIISFFNGEKTPKIPYSITQVGACLRPFAAPDSIAVKIAASLIAIASCQLLHYALQYNFPAWASQPFPLSWVKLGNVDVSVRDKRNFSLVTMTSPLHTTKIIHHMYKVLFSPIFLVLFHVLQSSPVCFPLQVCVPFITSPCLLSLLFHLALCILQTPQLLHLQFSAVCTTGMQLGKGNSSPTIPLLLACLSGHAE